MSGTKGMTHYPTEMKLAAVRLRQAEGLTYEQVAERLGIRKAARIERWCNAYREEGELAFHRPIGRPRKKEAEGLSMERLRMENALLKKHPYRIAQAYAREAQYRVIEHYRKDYPVNGRNLDWYSGQRSVSREPWKAFPDQWKGDRWWGKSLESVLLEPLRAQGMAGARVFRGMAGFGAHSSTHTTAIEVLQLDLPVVIEAIDMEKKIAAVLNVVYPMVREGLITLEDVQIVKYTHRYLNPLPADKSV